MSSQAAYPLEEPESRKIQLPYDNTFESIWEYKESYLSGRIDFFSIIGPVCPICGDIDCYRQIFPYFRYAIELFPEFNKERIPIARFLCQRHGGSFSMLPIQLIPYLQYTANAVIGTLLLGFQYWQMGRRGFYGASVEVDADSLVTPWLVACWLAIVARGLRRAHAVLGRFYNLSDVHTLAHRTVPWEEVSGYFLAFSLKPTIPWAPMVLTLCSHYSRATGRFLFGVPSQQRAAILK
ncbi:MAG: hypothetical protein ABIL06_12790 [Pseudomonadota bacterium]